MNDEKNIYQSFDSGNELTVWTVVRLLLDRFYWLVLSGIVFAVGTYLVLTFFATPTYESWASFYVYNSSDSASHSGTINNNDLQAAESLATTYSKILSSNSVLDAVLQELGDQAISRKELSKMVNVSVVTDTQLLEVVITSTDPQFACEVANAFVTVAPTKIVRITKAGGVEIVDHPEVATEKSSPRTVFDTAVGLLVGVIVAAVIVIVRTLSDTTIYLPEDVEKLNGITVLGQIPEIEAPEGKYNYWKMEEGGVIRHDEEKNLQ